MIPDDRPAIPLPIPAPLTPPEGFTAWLAAIGVTPDDARIPSR